MPEGDTIHRTARTLQKVLAGRRIDTVAHAETFDGADLEGHQVVDVEARGKHLLVHFDDGRVLHSHMGMHGSWHVYRPGEPWQLSERKAAVSLHNEEWVAVCFTPPVLELLSPKALVRHRALSRLGPDLLGRTLDRDAVLGRFRVHDVTPIGEAVMWQSIVSGIGNVYKSEVLFLTNTNPFVPVGKLEDEHVLEIVDRARLLLHENVDGGPRTTREADDRQRVWVYERSGAPCRACGTRVRMRRQGDLGRSTYWCPRCQWRPDPWPGDVG